MDVILENGIAESHAVCLVRVAAAKTGQMVVGSKHHGAVVGIGVLTGIVAFYEIEFLIDEVPLLAAQRVADAQKLLAAGMRRTEDTAVVVDDLDQKQYRKTAQLKDRELHVRRHDDEDVSGVDGIVFNPLQDNEILRLIPELLIVPVGSVGVVIGDQHALIAFAFENLYRIKERKFAVRRAFLGVTVHIKFHK